MTENRGANRRWLLAPVAVGLVVLAVVTTVIAGSGGDSSPDPGSSTSPTTGGDLGFPAPDAGDAAADREHLGRDGRVLLVMHGRAEAVVSAQMTAEQCRQEAEELDQAAPADEVASRIGGLADPVLRDAFHAERTALGVELTRCISGAPADDRVPPLQEAVEAVDVRLAELGD